MFLLKFTFEVALNLNHMNNVTSLIIKPFFDVKTKVAFLWIYF